MVTRHNGRADLVDYGCFETRTGSVWVGRIGAFVSVFSVDIFAVEGVISFV
jgi:hypothetical protein